MRIELRIDGGLASFPGLAQPLVVDSAALPEEDAARLQELVQRCRLFDRPQPGEAAGAEPVRRRDARRYVLTADGPDGRRTLVLHDPLEPELVPLVDFLRARQRAARRASR